MWKKLSRIIFKNIHLKIVALVVAYGVWFLVSTEELVFQDINVPIKYQYLPDNVTISGEKIESVKVRAQAPDSILRKLDESSIDVRLDLTDAKMGTQFFRLTAQLCRAPYGVKITEFFPSTIQLKFEPKIVESIPVEPRIEGAPAPGYELKMVRAVPASVEIIGAQSEVETVKAATTGAVSVAGKKAAVTESVTLDVGNPAVQIMGSNRVRITAVIGPIIKEKTFEDLPIRASDCDHQVRLRPAAATLTLSGPAHLLEALSRDSLALEVALPDCNPGQTYSGMQISVNLASLPSGDQLRPVSILPGEATARIYKE